MEFPWEFPWELLVVTFTVAFSPSETHRTGTGTVQIDMKQSTKIGWRLFPLFLLPRPSQSLFWGSNRKPSFRGSEGATARIGLFWGVSRTPSFRGGESTTEAKEYGRISDTEFRLTPEEIETFHREGCVTIPDVLSADEVAYFEGIFDQFVAGEIHVPGKDFCDMSKPFGVPYEEWSIVNCMLPTRYHPPLRDNIYEKLTQSMASQLFDTEMKKDYDQFLNKRPGQPDAVFAWHQDMAYWPSARVLGVNTTSTCTFSLAIDDSAEANGCLRYVAGSGVSKELRPHRPLASSREEGHAVTVDVANNEPVVLAPAKSGSITIHDEYVVHGSGGNNCPDRQRRTYVLAYRDRQIVEAERRIGFTHSHNDKVNWDTFENLLNDDSDKN